MAPREIDPGALRTVHVSAVAEVLKPLYYDPDQAAVRPNLVFVDPNGAVICETNEAGLKGGALDPRRRLAIAWETRSCSALAGAGRVCSTGLRPVGSF